jgi:hypothetical protein
MVYLSKLNLYKRHFISRTLFLLYYIYNFLRYSKPNPAPLKRSHDQLVIFGSGPSVNALSEEDLAWLRRDFDTMSFSMFYRKSPIDIDFHIIREITPLPNPFSEDFRVAVRCEGDLIEGNRHYKRTHFLVHWDIFSPGPLVWFELFGRGKKLTFYSTKLNRLSTGPISRSLFGIPHSGATLFNCLNIALIMGYKRVLLVGVDLMDSRYFYLPGNIPHFLSGSKVVTEPHPTARVVLQNITRWRDTFEKNRVELIIWNSDSALAAYLPVWK